MGITDPVDVNRAETGQSVWKILIVEDHKLTNECLKLGLEKYPDLTVVGQAMDAQTALKLAQQTQPDVILMDVCLAEGNGIQVTEAIKKAFPKTKVIMTTSMVDANVVRAAFSVNADGYCTKETELSALVQTIHTVMNGTVCIDPKVIAAMMRQADPCELLTAGDLRHETLSHSHASAAPVSARAKSIPVFSEAPVFDATSAQGSFQKVSFSQQPASQVASSKPISVPFSEAPTDEAEEKAQPAISKPSHISFAEQTHVADAITANPEGPQPKVADQLNPRETEILKLIALNYTNDRIAAKLGLSSAWLSGYIKNILSKLNVSNEIQAVQRALEEGVISEAPLLSEG